MIPGKPRDAEMASQMKQINRAQISIQRHQIEIFRRRKQHHHARDVHVGKVDPKVGLPCVERVALAMCRDQMPPAGGFILPSNKIEPRRIIESGRGKMVAMNSDAI